MIWLGISDCYESDGLACHCPKDHRMGDWVSSYARCFNALETDFGRWQTRQFGSLRMMAKDAPGGFRLAVTVHCGANQQIRPGDFVGLSDLLHWIRLLQEYDKLACLVVRLSNPFRPDIESASLFKRLRSIFSGLPLAVEFHYDEIPQQQTLDLLRKMDMALVCVEDPQPLPGNPKVVAVTSKLGYLRFHSTSNPGCLQGPSEGLGGGGLTVESSRTGFPGSRCSRSNSASLHIHQEFLPEECSGRCSKTEGPVGGYWAKIGRGDFPHSTTRQRIQTPLRIVGLGLSKCQRWACSWADSDPALPAGSLARQANLQWRRSYRYQAGVACSTEKPAVQFACPQQLDAIRVMRPKISTKDGDVAMTSWPGRISDVVSIKRRVSDGEWKDSPIKKNWL